MIDAQKHTHTDTHTHSGCNISVPSSILLSLMCPIIAALALLPGLLPHPHHLHHIPLPHLPSTSNTFILGLIIQHAACVKTSENYTKRRQKKNMSPCFLHTFTERFLLSVPSVGSSCRFLLIEPDYGSFPLTYRTFALTDHNIWGRIIGTYGNIQNVLLC